MNYWQRATYSTGLISFKNPSREAALECVTFCAVDSMYHVFLRYSPIENDPKFELIRKKIRDSNRKHNSSDPGIAMDDRGNHGAILSMWFPGDVDLEDMVAIVEGVKEFDTAWLRPEFNKFKEQAGLSADDLPHLNRFDRWYVEDQINVPWYKNAGYSAKGGTVFFEYEPQGDLVKNFLDHLVQNGANLEQFTSTNTREGQFSLRFVWDKPKERLGHTRKVLEQALFVSVGVTPAAQPEGYEL